jgi:hypothetical protein
VRFPPARRRLILEVRPKRWIRWRVIVRGDVSVVDPVLVLVDVEPAEVPVPELVPVDVPAARVSREPMKFTCWVRVLKASAAVMVPDAVTKR